MTDIVKKLLAYIPDGDGYNCKFGRDMQEAAEEITLLRTQVRELRLQRDAILEKEVQGMVERLRGYQDSWADAIKRMDCGEYDNGAMAQIRAEQHATFKGAADLIERLAG